LRRVYRLPIALRSRLSKPLGRVFSQNEAGGVEFRNMAAVAPMVVTVGDRVTDTLQSVGRTPEVQVVDGFERRQKREYPKAPYARLIKVKNPAGAVTVDAIEGVRAAFMGKKPVRVQVDGEEDLMAMLAIAMAPVSAMVFYGQPGVGLVAVKANAISKARNRAILAKLGIKDLR
jgi:GTP-dependent dephospho-CoA kinase